MESKEGQKCVALPSLFEGKSNPKDLQPSLFEGQIACIQNKYVILNDKRFISPTPILSTLLPNDIVSYSVNPQTNKIKIIKLINRKPFVTLATINKFNVLVFSEFPANIFSYKVNLYEQNLSQKNILIVKIDINGVTILKKYDALNTTRLNDSKIILDIYKYNAELNNVDISFSNLALTSFYTDSYQNLEHLETFNIDPVGSKDFDDAISIDHKSNKIYIHIVDAHEQILLNSDIDKEAFKKSFTLYLSEYIENILPKELAENELSLIKGKVRKTITLEYIIDEDMSIKSYKIYKSSIIIKNRYCYESYDKLIETSNNENIQFIKKFVDKHKIKTIETIKNNINLDQDGKIINFVKENMHTFSHKIVETLMILANLTISKHLSNDNNNDIVSSEKLKDNITNHHPCPLALGCKPKGLDLPSEKLRDDVVKQHHPCPSEKLRDDVVKQHHPCPQRYHTRCKTSDVINEAELFTGNKEIDLILTIKKYRKALYSENNTGHFGLGLSTYTHFTSPIRRYFDVIIHRLLAGVKFNNLEEILSKINDQEQHVDKLCKLYNNIKILDYFDRNKDKIWIGWIVKIIKTFDTGKQLVSIMFEDILYEVTVLINNNLQVNSKVNIKINQINWIELKPEINIV